MAAREWYEIVTIKRGEYELHREVVECESEGQAIAAGRTARATGQFSTVAIYRMREEDGERSIDSIVYDYQEMLPRGDDYSGAGSGKDESR